MPLSPKQKSRLKVTGTIVFLGISLGLIFPMFSDGFTRLRPYVVGVLIGIFVGLAISWFEFFAFKRVIRKSNFLTIILVRTFSYAIMSSIIVLVVVAVVRSIDLGVSVFEIIQGEDFQNYVFHEEFLAVVVYTFVLAFLANFIRQLSKKMGQGVLLHFITGKYHKPREEERIFMFLDITSSTTIAEKIGHLQFHKLINEFFYDITGSIINNKGEIYQYVGDEVVVTWSMKNGTQNANCIKTFFQAKKAIAKHKEKYQKKYGLVPDFKAGYHCGKVIRGEVGDVKSEIAYHGDVVNTTARIMAQSGELKKNLLLSGNLVKLLPPLDGFQPERLQEIALRGKEESIEIYGDQIDAILPQ